MGELAQVGAVRTQKAPMNIANVVYGDRSHFASKTERLIHRLDVAQDGSGGFIPRSESAIDRRLLFCKARHFQQGALSGARRESRAHTPGTDMAGAAHALPRQRLPPKIASTYLDVTAHHL